MDGLVVEGREGLCDNVGRLKNLVFGDDLATSVADKRERERERERERKRKRDTRLVTLLAGSFHNSVCLALTRGGARRMMSL